MSFGFIIINMAIFSLAYFLIKDKKMIPKSFLFGVFLHLLSLVLICQSVELADRQLNFLIASVISIVISGYVYKRLNSIASPDEFVKH